MSSTVRPLGTDLPLDNAPDVSREAAVLSYTLAPDALERYRQVGADAAAAVAEVASSLETGMSEYEAAANLAATCRRPAGHGASQPRLLAAADNRIATTGIPSRTATCSSDAPCWW